MRITAFPIAAAVLMLGAPAVEADPDSCVIQQFVTARKLVSLNPRGVTARFTRNDPWVFTLARLNCLKVEKGEALWFRWVKDGREFFRARAEIGEGESWRIWGRIKARPGRWKIQLTTGGGRVMAERDFVVQGKEPPPKTPPVR